MEVFKTDLFVENGLSSTQTPDSIPKMNSTIAKMNTTTASVENGLSATQGQDSNPKMNTTTTKMTTKCYPYALDCGKECPTHTPEWRVKDADRKEAQRRRQAERMEKLESVEEVSFVKKFIVSASRSMSKDDFLDQHGEGLREEDKDKLWAKFLDENGAEFDRHGTAEIELEDEEVEDDDNYEVEYDDLFDDIEKMKDEFAVKECEWCGSKDVGTAPVIASLFLCEECGRKAEQVIMLTKKA